MFWYTRHVGKIAPYPLLWEETDAYWTREDAGYTNFIKKTDATLLYEKESTSE